MKKKVYTLFPLVTEKPRIEAKDLQKQALDPKMKDHVWLWLGSC